MSWLVLVALAVLAAVWLCWRVRNSRMLAIAKTIPGPPTLPGLGNALKFMCQPEDFIKVIQEIIRDYGDVLKFWLGPELNVIVNNPDDIKILLSNKKTSVKGPQYKYMKMFIGDGILSGSGPVWRKHRKIASPNYGKRAIESYSDVFNEEVDLLLQQYRSRAGQQFNIYSCIVQTTSYSLCRCLMGLRREQVMTLPYLQEIIDDTPRQYKIIFDRMTKWYLQIDPVFWLTRFYQQQNTFVAKVAEFGRAIIEHRVAHLQTLENQNKMNLMNSASDEGNTQLSVIDRFILSKDLNMKELIDESFTVFTTGQEASAKIASYVLLMMAYHPDCQEKLYAEIIRVIGEADRPVTDDDLKQMPYLDMAYKEVLRLFPIGALIQRTVTEDIDIGSGTIPAGCSLVLPIYYLHREPRFWNCPDAFDPERFSPENSRARHPYCYIPFSLGPMDCLGRYFGTKLIKTICVRVLHEFALTSTNAYKDLKLSITISVFPINGFHVKLTPRK